MNRLLVAVAALPLLAASAQAQCCGPKSCGGSIGFGIGLNVNLSGYASCMPGCGPMCGGCGPGPAQLGPWYQYWPLEAHFQTPAPTGYPYWPSAQTLPNGNGALAPGEPVTPAAYMPGTPSYWYGR